MSEALLAMREHLIAAKDLASDCGFSFEVGDAFSELVGFVEFELDGMGVEYE